MNCWIVAINVLNCFREKSTVSPSSSVFFSFGLARLTAVDAIVWISSPASSRIFLNIFRKLLN